MNLRKFSRFTILFGKGGRAMSTFPACLAESRPSAFHHSRPFSLLVSHFGSRRSAIASLLCHSSSYPASEGVDRLSSDGGKPPLLHMTEQRCETVFLMRRLFRLMMAA
jgi:hypothetical protein